jgi:hypothetical protein
MAKNFRLDLGSGRRPTRGGWTVVLAAAAAALIAPEAIMYGTEQFLGRFEPFETAAAALASAVGVWAIGRIVLYAAGIPYSHDITNE